VGACLLAKAAAHPTFDAPEPTLSRAGSFPQGTLRIVQNAGAQQAVVQNKTGPMPSPIQQPADFNIVCTKPRLA
jgi:hypothetical protein